MKNINSAKKLAIALENGNVNIQQVSKALAKRVDLWASRKEILIVDGEIIKNW